MHCVVSGVAPRRYSVKLWAEEDQDRDFSFWIPDASRQATHRIVVEYADAMAMPKALLNQLKSVRIPDGSSINNTHSGGYFFSGQSTVRVRLWQGDMLGEVTSRSGATLGRWRTARAEGYIKIHCAFVHMMQSVIAQRFRDSPLPRKDFGEQASSSESKITLNSMWDHYPRELTQSNREFLVETDHGRKSVTARMDDSDASPISESEVLEGSVASAAASGSAAPEFIRLPECETTAANELDGYWQRRGKCSARRRISQFYMTGTTTWKQNTITDERALARFFDPQVIFQVQNRLHIHRSWRTSTRPSISEPKQQTQSTEFWNPDTFYHGKLERVLTYFDADVITFQGTMLRVRTIPKDGKARDETITPVRSEWCSRGYQIFSWG